MLNQSGISKVSAVTLNQIDMFPQESVAVGIVVSDGNYVTVDGKKIVKAGTPLYGDLTARGTKFEKAVNVGENIPGVYTVQIKTAATAGDIITVENVDYTHGAEESVANKVFIGTSAAEQVTSLLKMVACDDFTVAAVAGSADKIKFTQKVADTGNTPVVRVTKAPSTGAIVVGNIVTTTVAVEGSVESNAVGVLLHDVEVTNGDANGTLLIGGYVNLDRLDATTAVLITSEVKAALKGNITFLK